jgi:hypothetical protein
MTSGVEGRFLWMARRPFWVVAVLFVVLALPGTYPASRSHEELFTFSMDEPMFMVPPMRDIVMGRYPRFYTYGNFPSFMTSVIFLPVILAFKLLHVEVSYFHIVMMLRLGALVAALGALVFLYRLGRHWCSPATALAAVVLVMTAGTLWEWTWTLHPDVFQAFALVASVYFLVKYHDERLSQWLWISAVFAGFAAGSKYWGIFIVPAALVSIWSNDHLGRVSAKVIRAVGYLALVIGVFVVVNAEFVVHFRRLIHIGQTYAVQHGMLHASVFNPLLKAKLDCLGSAYYFGTLFCVVYATALIEDIARWARAPAKPHSMLLIHLTIVTLGLYYFVFFNDPANVEDGERYLLGFMMLMVLPALALLETALGEQRTRMLGLCVVAVLVCSQAARIAGVPASTVWLGQSGVFNQGQFSSLPDILREYYDKEQQGRFLVDQWVSRWVDWHRSLYIEAYMNVRNERRALGEGKVLYDYAIRRERVAKEQPDYVFTKDVEIANAVVREAPYDLVTVLGIPESGRVYVLRNRTVR